MGGSTFGRGVFFAVLSFAVWGVLPLYWKLLEALNPMHILAFRVLGSLLLVGAILALRRNFAWLRAFKEPKKAGLLILTAFTLTLNWGIYIWAVNQGHTIEASLGYYMNPVVAVVLGLLFLREKLRPLQWAAFFSACIGVIILAILSGGPPWISISLAFTFSFYGLLKKTLKLSALEYLGAETLAAAPFALFLLFFAIERSGGLPRPVFDGGSLSYIAALPPGVLIAMAFCGAVSAFPLYCFTEGAKALPLSTLGFIQLLSPTLQFLLGLFVFHEYFPAAHFIAFAFIWFAVILYVVSLSGKRNVPPAAPSPGAPE